MTRNEYIGHLTALYRQANRSDTEMGEAWQRVSQSHTHCVAIEAIAREMMSAEEYQAWLDSI